MITFEFQIQPRPQQSPSQATQPQQHCRTGANKAELSLHSQKESGPESTALNILLRKLHAGRHHMRKNEKQKPVCIPNEN